MIQWTPKRKVNINKLKCGISFLDFVLFVVYFIFLAAFICAFFFIPNKCSSLSFKKMEFI